VLVGKCSFSKMRALSARECAFGSAARAPPTKRFATHAIASQGHEGGVLATNGVRRVYTLFIQKPTLRLIAFFFGCFALQSAETHIY